MTEEVLPAVGGIPWGYALAGLGVLGTVVGTLWKAHAAGLKERIDDLVLSRDLASAAKEALRVEMTAKVEAAERRADALEKELRDHLNDSIRVLSAVRSATAAPDRAYPPRPPRGSVKDLKADFRRLSEVISPEAVMAARAMVDRAEMDRTGEA